MKPNEALEIITNAVQTEKMTAEQDKALAVAQKVLERQIPTKVVCHKISNEIILKYCPTCRVRFLRYGHKYCSECGQKLDWSDEE